MLHPTIGRGSVCRLLASLLYGLESHMDESEDSNFLQDTLMGNTLHLLIRVYERLLRFGAHRPKPIQDSAECLAGELAVELKESYASPEAAELCYLLSNPHLKSLLSVHDSVARKDYDPELPPLPDNICDEEEDSVKIVQLVKKEEPLGATIRRDEVTGAIVVARIMKGGAADRSGLIHEGDELREVNGIPMEDKDLEDIIPILAQADGAVTFKVIPGTKEEPTVSSTKTFVRALFDYDPEDDPAIPCKQAGLAFKRGNVLQIVCEDDEVWWQARHHDTDSQAGLIPSRELQERRVTLQKPEALFHPPKSLGHGPEERREDVDYGAITGIHIAGLRKSFRLSRRNSDSRQLRWRRFKRHRHGLIPTYLEVVPYQRGPGDPRRMVLMFGPSGVGLSELKRKLLLSDPELYSVTVPHTSREPRKQEKEGVEYHFVSRHTFEKDILNHKFIEYGEHGGNYYGTSLESVQRVLAEGKVCLLDVEPQTVEKLYTREFKPCVVLVKPPPIERLRLSRRKTKVISSRDERTQTKTLTEEDFEDMIASAHTMENQYGHLVEVVIVNDDLGLAFTELRDALARMEKESQWIPAAWGLD
ncbi:MAGUK p55 subfamily member 7-like [Alosa sapidissima]|uniref:MAGUK p55 subfamily member 7-like n=1 Tax=Alosa sapidissima TaxID=34773 RepID=UPI001C099918|nr:MAGUK p55 subfamily member 7-like [Alosa sapidissima]